MRRRFLSSSNSNYFFIVYTTSDENVINLKMPNIISNSYDDGVGYIKFGSVPLSLPTDVFRDCGNLTSIILGFGILSIGNYAFSGCTSLTSITIPNSVTSIGYSALQGCSSLTSVTIPNSVTSIEYGVFSGCTSLTSITIPNSVTSIGVSAFRDCTSLPSITIPDSVTSIGGSAFAGCTSLKAFYGKFTSADNRCLIIDGVLNSFAPVRLYQYTIPDGVTSIGESAFYNYTSLTSITIPDSVTSIEYGVFFGCTSLTSITIPDSVTSIGVSAFRGCTSLTSITIPDSVTSIDSFAFSGCSSLASVYCKPTIPPTGGYGMFSSNASNRIIYVPTASVDAYKSAQYWSNYADYIVGYDFEDDGSSELITFSVSTSPINSEFIEYTAEEGMTWSEWINSSYNTDGFYLDEYGVCNSDSFSINIQGKGIKGTDVIIPNEIYKL